MLRFTIRDLLWLMVVVVGLGVGWWLDRNQLKERMDGLVPDPAVITIHKVQKSP